MITIPDAIEKEKPDEIITVVHCLADDGSQAEAIEVGLTPTSADNPHGMSNLHIGVRKSGYCISHLPPDSLRRIGQVLIGWADKMEGE